MDRCPSLILASKFANSDNNFKLSQQKLEALVNWCFNIDINAIKLLAPNVYRKTTLLNIHGFLYDMCIDKIRCDCSPTCEFHKNQLSLGVNLIKTIIGDPIKTSQLNLVLNSNGGFGDEEELSISLPTEPTESSSSPPQPHSPATLSPPPPPPTTTSSTKSNNKFKFSFSKFFRNQMRKIQFCKV